MHRAALDDPAPVINWDDQEGKGHGHPPTRPAQPSAQHQSHAHAPATPPTQHHHHHHHQQQPATQPAHPPAPAAASPPPPAPAARHEDRNEDARSSSIASSAVAGSQDHLLYEREVLDAMFHHIPIGVILINAWGVIRGFSKGAERMFMYSSWELVGENIRQVMPQNVSDRHDYYLSRARQRITQRLATIMHVNEATLALDNIYFSDSEQERKICNDVLRMSMFGGQKREVLGMDKTASPFPLEITVSPVILNGAMFYLGYLLDVRDLTLFQDLTVKQELLLRGLLDSRVMSRLLAGEQLINDFFPSASVATVEIVDYVDKAVALDNDMQRAEFLQDVWTMADRVIVASSIEKIKSIGNVLVIASGVPAARENHAPLLFGACCALMHAIHTYNDSLIGQRKGRSRRQGGSKSAAARNRAAAGKEGAADDGWKAALAPVHLRIGIHTGPVIGAVYSRLKGEYDLFGNTVLRSGDLMRKSRPQYLHLSNETFQGLTPVMQSVCDVRHDMGIPYTYEVFYREELESALEATESFPPSGAPRDQTSPAPDKGPVINP